MCLFLYMRVDIILTVIRVQLLIYLYFVLFIKFVYNYSQLLLPF